MSVQEVTVTAMPRASKIWDRYAEGYAKRPVADQAAYERKLKVTQSYLSPEKEVLEFACGTGTTALIQAPFVKHIRAVDISAKMIEIAKQKAEDAGVENVSFEQMTIEELDVPDGTYDVIMGHSILHLLDNKEAVIAKVRRMLRPDGVFVSSTACIGDSMKWFKLIGPIGHFFGLIPKVQVFDEKALVDSITAGGFEIDHHWRPEGGTAVFIVAKPTV